jgi:hypothetical protein
MSQELARSQESESVLFLEDYEFEIQQNRFNTHFTVWPAHLVSILLWAGLLAYTLIFHRDLPKNCLQKFNSYCKCISSMGSLCTDEVFSAAPILEAINEDGFQDVKFKYSLWYQSPFKDHQRLKSRTHGIL